MDGQGNLESTWKVRKKSGNLKIKWLLSLHKLYLFCSRGKKYGSLPKTSNTLNIRTPKIIAKYNLKMFPKISNSGSFSEIEFLKFRTVSFFAKKREFFILFTRFYNRENLL